MLGEAGWAPGAWPELAESFRWGDAWTNRRQAFLEEAGLALTNVFPFRPQGNNIETICGPKAAVGPGYAFPALKLGQYILPEYVHHVERLRQELASARPNLVVCLGNVACWAVLRATNIGSIRGSVAEAQLVPGMKCLATYHPAGVLRNWSWRPIVLADLMKAARQGEFPEIRRPKRAILVNPAFEEAMLWFVTTRMLMDSGHPRRFACDTETAQGQITCISFATSNDSAITIPFVKMKRDSTGHTVPNWENYWEDEWEEYRVWQEIKWFLESGCEIVGQNFIYDLQYLLPCGIFPRRCAHDTMLLHHSIFPEMNKGLGFLGSIYSDEASWKLMRRRRQGEGGEKRDE